MLEYTTLLSGTTVGPNVDLSQRIIDAIYVPTWAASCDLLIQGNPGDQTSANFFRLMDTRAAGSADLRFAIGIGSRMLPWPPGVPQPAYARFEAAVATTDIRTLTLVTRNRR